MGKPKAGRKRQRGSIDKLPSGALRVRAYSGVDPVTKRDLYLTEVVPAGPGAETKAEQVRTKFLNQVDEKRNPRTRATVRQAVDRWMELTEHATTTRTRYESVTRNHIDCIAMLAGPPTRLSVTVHRSRRQRGSRQRMR